MARRSRASLTRYLPGSAEHTMGGLYPRDMLRCFACITIRVASRRVASRRVTALQQAPLLLFTTHPPTRSSSKPSSRVLSSRACPRFPPSLSPPHSVGAPPTPSRSMIFKNFEPSYSRYKLKILILIFIINYKVPQPASQPASLPPTFTTPSYPVSHPLRHRSTLPTGPRAR